MVAREKVSPPSEEPTTMELKADRELVIARVFNGPARSCSTRDQARAREAVVGAASRSASAV